MERCKGLTFAGGVACYPKKSRNIAEDYKIRAAQNVGASGEKLQTSPQNADIGPYI